MNFNLNKTCPAYIDLILGFATVIVGILFFVDYQFVWDQFQSIIVILIVINIVTNIVKYDNKNKKMNFSISLDVVLLFISLVLIANYNTLFIALFPLFAGFYILAISLTRFIRAYIFFVDKIRFKVFVLLDAIISLFFATRLLFHPVENTRLFSYYIGVYFLFYGGSFILRSFNQIFLASTAQFAMPVPVFIAAFIPANTLEHIDEIVNVEKEDRKTDLEIFIYLRKGGMGQFGHMDFSYKGLTYSYGAFDYHSHKLGGGYGDGVLIVADRDKFLKHGNVFKKASVIKYGLKLNDEQKALIEGRIESLLSRCKRHYSDAEIDEMNGQLKDDYDSYLANVYLNTHAKSYKFTHGRFKTYFVLSTNCVNVAAYVLQMKGLDIINIKGLITPGTYLHYLNNEYLSNSNIVVSRYVYEK